MTEVLFYSSRMEILLQIGRLTALKYPPVAYAHFCTDNKYVTFYHRKTCIHGMQSVCYASESFKAGLIDNNILVK
jgi:hypothetical protein